MPLNYKLVALVILDGFGIAPPSQSNAVSLAQKPFFDSLIKDYPSVLLQASGLSVGLPRNEVGNSEVGHLNIGSGILRYQSLPRINKSISTGQFFKLPAMLEVSERMKKKNNKLHILGLIGTGGVHSSQEHLEAVINFAKASGFKDDVYLHLFLDGRDTGKDVGRDFMKQTLDFCKQNKVGQVASVSGRFYAMDRNNNWDQIEKAYNAIVYGQSEKVYTDPLKAIDESYANKVYDEEFLPVAIGDKKGNPITKIEDGDSVIFFNFRADRARQLTSALIKTDFDKFEAKKFNDLYVVTFVEYEKGLPVEVLFSPEIVKTPIAKVFSDYNLKQLHIAETEKYAHVTFFMNGLIEEPFVGEERILVPSPGVSSYDQQPEMSSVKVNEEIVKAIKSDKFNFIAINYANPDMVGHTGNLQATIKAVEAVDRGLSQIIPLIVKKGGIVFVIADHGNAEELFNQATGSIDKEHNFYPVPMITVGSSFVGNSNPQILNNDLSLLTPVGILADIAPTILGTIGLDVPPEMTGTNLLGR